MCQHIVWLDVAESCVLASVKCYSTLLNIFRVSSRGVMGHWIRYLLLCWPLCSTASAQETSVLSGDKAEEIFRHKSFVEANAEKPEQGVSDPEMQEAIDHAQSTLDTFLTFAGNPKEGMSGFKLKVVLKDGQDAETFWVMPFRRIDEAGKEEFEGVLANTPEVLKNVQLGQVVRFTRKEVVDWGFVNLDRQIGSFTVCVMFKRIPKQQADYFREFNGFDC